MADQIYREAFYANINPYYQDEDDARNKVLIDANEFFRNNDNYIIISIIEDWNEQMTHLSLIVYYKECNTQ